MKKFLTFALVCCLVFSSSSTVFATATQWDTSDQANLRYIYQSVTSGGSLYTVVNNIYTRVNTISNTLTDIKSYLFSDNNGIAYWVHAISTWMSPIYTAIKKTPTELESIKRLLGYVSYEGETEVIDPYLAYQSKGIANWVSDIYSYLNNAHVDGFSSGNNVNLWVPQANGSYSRLQVQMGNKNSFDNMLNMFRLIHDNITNTYYYEFEYLGKDFNSIQSATDWTNLNSNIQFTPSSVINGLYSWLSNIQTPIARLSYVLASDERIEAQEKAADNEQVVVDNFIDSSGSGAASTSDFGNVSDLSSGFKNNISTDASVSGIWNIFNADNFGWFSQETADQLDTSSSGTKTLRSSGSYPTPLLDQQTEDILKYIGGENND